MGVGHTLLWGREWLETQTEGRSGSRRLKPLLEPCAPSPNTIPESQLHPQICTYPRQSQAHWRGALGLQQDSLSVCVHWGGCPSIGCVLSWVVSLPVGCFKSCPWCPPGGAHRSSFSRPGSWREHRAQLTVRECLVFTLSLQLVSHLLLGTAPAP